MLRSTPRRDSALASLVIEELGRRAGRHYGTQGGIQIGTVGQSDPGPPLPDDLEQRRVGQCDAWTRLTQLRHHLAAIRYKDLLPVPHKAEILTETVLQLTNTYSLHGLNVAT
jgi:hypothetical protein